MKSTVFERFGGLCAIFAGGVGLLYSLSFVVVGRSNPSLGTTLSAAFLMLGGLLSSAVMVALYSRLQETESMFALWALVLGAAGALGAVLHGAYDLANAIHVPETIDSNLANLPSQVDPRGLLTFGVAGMAVFAYAALIVRGGQLPKNLGYLGYALGILLVVIYLARLIILDATNPVVVVTVVVVGFIVNPLWNVWLGISLRRASAA